MTYRAYRDNLSDVRESSYGIAGLADEVIYRIPGIGRREFVVSPERLAREACADCSVPMLEFRDQRHGKVTRVWHDETCRTAPVQNRVKPRILHRQR